MKIAVGSDHRGVDLKSRVLQWLQAHQHQAMDVGTHSTDSCDYPDVAHVIAGKVASGEIQRGILICGSGIGMSMAANKTESVRAAVCYDLNAAEMSRRHNDANVLCLSADRIERADDGFLDQMLTLWMTTEFDGGRHQRRVDKISRASTACNE